KFDKDKPYGGFSLPRGAVLENVLVGGSEDTKIDIVVEEKQAEAIVGNDATRPTGHAGKKSVPSAPQAAADRREARDRWRIGFPEYDRYGDRGGRGRDIPFKKGRWWNPYDQSVLKGDYPIIGNKTFFVLSATDTSTIELRRVPTASGASADDPRSAEFFGQPEQ